MEIVKFETRVLKASDGMYLTQATEVDIESRVVCRTAHLGINDIPENWREITEAEANTIIAEKEALTAALAEATEATEAAPSDAEAAADTPGDEADEADDREGAAS